MDAFPGLDPVIHHPARLRILAALAAGGWEAFPNLQHITGLTSGNLGSHLKLLVQGGYVESRRGLVQLRPRMRYRLGAAGRVSLLRYVEALRSAVTQMSRHLQADRPG